MYNNNNITPQEAKDFFKNIAGIVNYCVNMYANGRVSKQDIKDVAMEGIEDGILTYDYSKSQGAQLKSWVIT